jgi:hypothetical protein
MSRRRVGRFFRAHRETPLRATAGSCPARFLVDESLGGLYPFLFLMPRITNTYHWRNTDFRLHLASTLWWRTALTSTHHGQRHSSGAGRPWRHLARAAGHHRVLVPSGACSSAGGASLPRRTPPAASSGRVSRPLQLLRVGRPLSRVPCAYGHVASSGRGVVAETIKPSQSRHASRACGHSAPLSVTASGSGVMADATEQSSSVHASRACGLSAMP